MIKHRRRLLMGGNIKKSLYTLNNRLFSNENIDTGIKLLQADASWTIAYDISIASWGTATATSLLCCGTYATGLRIHRGGSGGGFATIMSYRSTEYRPTNASLYDANMRWKFVISHQKGSGVINCAAIRSNNRIRNQGTITAVFSSIQNTLILGDSGSGTTNTLPIGTINSFNIYNYAFTQEEIQEFTTF